ncbi:MAG: hypothetical protein ACM3O3_10760 [Syntrophothermus sp.]
MIINSCELQTGTAFRFGSKESGCWRLGKIVNNEVKLSTAVTASAAFPILLPALDRKWNLFSRDKKLMSKRLFLTDGGVYENLGISCLEPGKSELFSYNAFLSDDIICCNAGQGQFALDSFPSWWPLRVSKSFLSVFRKVQDNYADK